MEKRNTNPTIVWPTLSIRSEPCIALFKTASCKAALKIRILKICASSNRRYDVSRSANPFIWRRLKTNLTLEKPQLVFKRKPNRGKRGKWDSTPSQRAAFPSCESVRYGQILRMPNHLLKVCIRYAGRFSPPIRALLPFAYWLWYFGIPLRVFPQLCLTGHLLNLEPILIWLIRIVPQIFNLSSTNFWQGQ